MINNTLLNTRALVVALLPAVAIMSAGQAAAVPSSHLLELSIEELSDVRVTSASRRPEPLSTTAAAIFIITPDDIRRSGATSIPEALRLAPGLHVAQLDSRRWAISARGFNGEFANKLLVLIDGRSVYTPVHSGVNWDIQDMPLADIERIEVIRGPGAAQWGANAVNGVINIITKSAYDTRGGLVRVITGTELNSETVRWGGSLGDYASYRVYGKHFVRDEARAATGAGADDDWWQGRAGFRSDWNLPTADSFTVQGDVYQAGISRPFLVSSPSSLETRPEQLESHSRGGNLLGRWVHSQSTTNEFSLQAYLDWYQARPLQAEEDVIVADLDFQHHFQLGKRQQIVWGLGYRHIHDSFSNTFTIAFEPSSRTTRVFSSFLQDTIALTDRLSATLGARIEHNDYSGVEVQPSVQLAWMPNARHTLWGSVSRAVRTPNRAENDFQIQVYSNGQLVQINGNRNLRAEELLAYELGYRLSPAPGLFVDFTLFHHDYDHLIAFNGLSFGNDMRGKAEGLELAARWQAHPRWRLDLAYSYLEVEQRVAGGDSFDGSSPQHQISLFSRLDLSDQWQLDTWLRHVDHLPNLGVPSHSALDLRLGWQPRADLALSLVGQNLLDSRHLQFPDVDRIEIERALYLRLDLQF